MKSQKESATAQLEKFAENQAKEKTHRNLAEKNQATPEEAFNPPKDKNKQDRLLSACISLSLSAKTEFELYSYRVISPEQYRYNMVELTLQFTKLKNELT